MKDTLELLRLTARIMESWDEGQIPEIEKDTVLENLRKVYACVKFAGEDGCCDAANLPSAEPVAEPLPEPAVESAQQTVTVTLPVEGEPDGGPADDGDVTVEITQTPVPEESPLGAEEPPVVVNSGDEVQEFRDNILFQQADIPVKPKLDKKAILSLYGDDPAPVKVRETAEEPVGAPVSAEPAPAETGAEPADATPVPSMQSPADSEPVQVLGDVLGGGQTLGDVYSEQNNMTDVASVIGAGRVDGLKKAIGINDKFLIIRNLFNGDAARYENAITTLDGFSDLDDALIHIHENYTWDPDNEAVKLIVDLLTRKFS